MLGPRTAWLGCGALMHLEPWDVEVAPREAFDHRDCHGRRWIVRVANCPVELVGVEALSNVDTYATRG